MKKTLGLALLALAAAGVNGCQDRQAQPGVDEPSSAAQAEVAAETSPPAEGLARTVPAIEGFKDVAFGTPMQDVAALGYYCFNDKIEGYEGDLYACLKESTLFGLPANVRASIHEGVVYAISIEVKDSKPVDLSRLFADQFGPPQSFQVRAQHDLSTKHTSYWLSPSGTSVAVIRSSDIPGVRSATVRKLLNDGSAPVAGVDRTFYEQTAIYYGTAGTKELLKDAAAASVTADRDF